MWIDFQGEGQIGRGYLAVPPSGIGPSVLVLHAWWGLTKTFTDVSDQLAQAGFVALAPDLYNGATADTIDEAQNLLHQRDGERMRAVANSAIATLLEQPASYSGQIAVVGFSLGAAWAYYLSTCFPVIRSVITYYGTEECDFSSSQAAYLGHYAVGDEWESDIGVDQLERHLRAVGRPVTFHRYHQVNHWFAEPNRPEYDPTSAELAWERTLAFLRTTMPVSS